MRRVAIAVVLTVLPASGSAARQPAADPWRQGVCYEVFVRSFQDSDGDGVGDLRGLIERLDYINDGDPAGGSDLGATCLWLMPVMQSPTYHGYDVTNYYEVNRDYGTNLDFRELVAEARRRGIRVLVDLVLNHTSSEHPNFKSAVLERDSPYRNWYLWSPTERRMTGWEGTTWHRVPTRDEYYYGLFWHGMPDLNLANAEVQAEVRRVVRFWVEEMGVDGFRLDAVGHFFEDGGQWRHGAAVHPWLRDFAASVRTIDPDVFTVGEVWDSTGAILPYYGGQLDSYFMFDVADAIVEAVRTGAKQRLVDAVLRLQREVPTGRWGMFLRNHDQTRTLTDLDGDVARAQLAATLLLTLPGIPFVYYGEEIGMTGAKSAGDPRLRTPMPWTRAPGLGFTTGVPWEPPHADSLTANVEAQAGDAASLLHHYRRLIHLRVASEALGTGAFVPLTARQASVLAYVRTLDERAVLVAANLGDAPPADVEMAAPAGTLRPGRWTATPVGGGAPIHFAVAPDGSVSGFVVRALGALEGRVLELARTSN
jgi:alpha-amylase